MVTPMAMTDTANLFEDEQRFTNANAVKGVP
ncbi:hypothetical protein ATDW_08350 [Asticcacaulis sp. DW145]|nr:hypothetical protein ATDW_08350 [Asticcacaulis sp. DW145]